VTAPPTRRVDELAARRVAAAYLAGDGVSSGPLVRRAYVELATQADALLAAVVRRTGVRLAWTRVETPYAHDDELIASVRTTGVLEVPGIDPDRAHPVLGGATGGRYDRLRALHDLVGHVLPGFGFDRDGELSAWHAQDRLHLGLARWALATELHAHHSVLWTTGHLAQPRPLLLDPRLLRPSLQGAA
jgi:hypothetical protein